MRAPAKINLSLHIQGRRQDGYHEIESLVAFAGIGDNLTFTPGPRLTLEVTGPFAAEVGQHDENLVIRAAHAFQRHTGARNLGNFHLIKRLPAASGIGGGSADAGAALRLLAGHNLLPFDDIGVLAAAREVGADGPVCLFSASRMMRGIGETLGEPMKLPPLFAVLVHPGVPLSTLSVFARIGLNRGDEHKAVAHPDPVPALAAGFEHTIGLLNKVRNDMEDAACVLAPVIGDVLNVLMAARGCRLARMSGSGATCFALFETCRAAAIAAKVIRRHHPEWWVKATVLR